MKQLFTVTGMTCAACSARVEKAAKAVPGVVDAQVNLLGGTMSVELTSQDAVADIISAVQAAGYGASAGKKEKISEPADNTEKKMKIFNLCVFYEAIT